MPTACFTRGCPTKTIHPQAEEIPQTQEAGSLLPRPLSRSALYICNTYDDLMIIFFVISCVRVSAACGRLPLPSQLLQLGETVAGANQPAIVHSSTLPLRFPTPVPTCKASLYASVSLFFFVPVTCSFSVSLSVYHKQSCTMFSVRSCWFVNNE